ncbi:MAG: hypothetical protein HY046_09125 [Acidobacteria bacterium]|nr:hypothetical protein [Acidobacteriota bacterium]
MLRERVCFLLIRARFAAWCAWMRCCCADCSMTTREATAVHVGARQIAPRGDRVTPELVQKAHSAGLQVITWTVNQADHMRALADAGVDGIMTDFPDRLVAVLNQANAAKT